MQRMFLSLIAKGYKTISTDALTIITGIPPIKLMLEYTYQKTNLLQLNNSELADTLFPGILIQEKAHTKLTHPPGRGNIPSAINPFKDTYDIPSHAE